MNTNENGTIIGTAIPARNINFLSYDQVERLILDLLASGKLYLNPAALGPEMEAKYGDELTPGNQRITAAELKRMTTPFRSQNEREKIEAMSADEFYQSEHGRPLREERNRHADQAISEQELREAQAAVQSFFPRIVIMQEQTTIETKCCDG